MTVISETKRKQNREYYLQNKQYFADRRTGYIRAKKDRLEATKASTPCADCGCLDDPDLMDYHHLHSKEDTISRLIRNNVAWTRLQKELEKCVLLCCRCHRIRHRPVDPDDSAVS